MYELPENLDELIEANPQVDAQQLEEARELLRRLREIRGRGAPYELIPPGAGRRFVVGDNPERDPRTVHLRRSS